MAKITFHLTKGEWPLIEDRLTLDDCLQDAFENDEEFASLPDPREAVFKTMQKAFKEVFDVHKNGSCTVTINTEDRWHVEIFNESIEGSTVACNMKDNLDDYLNEENVKNAKSMQRHLRNIDKKLDALNCKQLHARWGV